jgi:hypothetical protein
LFAVFLEHGRRRNEGKAWYETVKSEGGAGTLERKSWHLFAVLSYWKLETGWHYFSCKYFASVAVRSLGKEGMKLAAVVLF